MDDGVYPGWVVPTEYDPLLGKLIAWAETREEAIARMQRALREYYVRGIKTNVAFFRRILAEPDFLASRIHTRWLDDLLHAAGTVPAPSPEPEMEDAILLAAALWHTSRAAAPATAASTASDSRWRRAGREELLSREPRR